MTLPFYTRGNWNSFLHIRIFEVRNIAKKDISLLPVDKWNSWFVKSNQWQSSDMHDLMQIAEQHAMGLKGKVFEALTYFGIQKGLKPATRK